MPFPVSDFFQILSIFSDVLLVLNQFVVSSSESGMILIAKLWQMHDCIFYKVETVNSGSVHACQME